MLIRTGRSRSGEGVPIATATTPGISRLSAKIKIPTLDPAHKVKRDPQLTPTWNDSTLTLRRLKPEELSRAEAAAGLSALDNGRWTGVRIAVLATLMYRAGLDFPSSAPLLCTVYGDPLTHRYARLLLKRLGERTGIAKRVHPHGLRHTHAAELRAEGVDIAIISKQLGHRSIATTARYLDHITPTDVIRAMRDRDLPV